MNVTAPLAWEVLRHCNYAEQYLALVTTDPDSPTADVVARYAARWSIEVAIFDAKQTAGVGQARNRTPNAVERTVPFGFYCLTLAIIWYAIAGHSPEVVAERRRRAPWYTSKTNPSVADMLAALRRVLIAAEFLPQHPEQPTYEEIAAVRLAWQQAAA